MRWSPHTYTRFEDERTRPVGDLLAHVATTPVGTAVDLGCGPGNSTACLQLRFPEADVTGLDNSAEMIAAARLRSLTARFAIGDIAGWHPADPVDVILANASLQWMPDHEALLPALVSFLAPGGSLAVQMPDNFDEPAHCLMRDVAATGPWAARCAAAAPTRGRLDADRYYRIARDCGASVDLWRTVYYHPLPGGAAEVVDWFAGTGLRPFLEVLNEGEREHFLARYQARVADAYQAQPNGTVLLPFPRLFLVAVR